MRTTAHIWMSVPLPLKLRFPLVQEIEMRGKKNACVISSGSNIYMIKKTNKNVN